MHLHGNFSRVSLPPSPFPSPSPPSVPLSKQARLEPSFGNRREGTLRKDCTTTTTTTTTTKKKTTRTTELSLAQAIIFHSRVAARRISAGGFPRSEWRADARGREKKREKGNKKQDPPINLADATPPWMRRFLSRSSGERRAVFIALPI